MIGLASKATCAPSADTIAAIPEVDYVVIVGGSFDLLLEVVCEDDDHLLALLQRQDPLDPRRPRAPRRSPTSASTSRRTPGEPDERPRTEAHAATRARRSSRTGTCGCTSAGSASYGPTHDVPIIVRGEGCYVWDATRQALPRRAVGALHRAGRARPRRARRGRGRDQAETLEYFPIWTYAHPPAIELAARLAELAPGDLNRVFFTSGGSEAVESAWKLARQYFRAIGEGAAPQGDRAARSRTTARRSARSRSPACPRLRTPFEPLTPGRVARREHQPLPAPARRRREGVHARGHRRDRGARSSSRVPRPSPRCSSSRCRTPAAASCLPTGYFERVREICDRYGVLLVSDEVICAFGRLGEMFGVRALRLPARHDHVREGAHERLLAARRGDLSRPPRRAVPRGHRVVLARHHLRRPPGELRGRRSPTSTCSSAKACSSTSAPTRPGSGSGSRRCATSRSSATSAAPGYFLALELVTDQQTRRGLQRRGVGASCCADSSRRACSRPGSICRTDDRGDPVVQLAPPLDRRPRRVRRDRGDPAHRARPRRGSGSARDRTSERAP